jgi:chain length determinant protein (polysaccharide antigen chain regulator)
MQQNMNESHYYEESEIDLRHLAKSLKERTRFIFGLTGLITLIAIAYVLYQGTFPLQYKVEISFLKPTDTTVLNLNKFQLLSETKDSIYTRFLNLVSSKSFQKSVLLDGDYVNKLNETNEAIDDVEAFASKLINSTQLSVFEIDSKGKGNNNDNYQAFTKIELPYILSITGENPDVLSEYLDEVASKANQETILNIANLEQQKIAYRLEAITLEKNMLLAKAKEDRLSQIQRINEEDAQKIRELNDLIERARYKAKKERINDIETLTAAAKLAGSLGIIDNNLGKINESNNDINLNIAINETDDLPEWYLFGEKALLERVESLKSRTSDDPFIPELVSLNNQINEIQNNNLLQTLEERQDDSPFIARINELDIESAKLKSIILDITGIDAMQVQQYASAMPIPSNSSNRLLIVLALFGGFVMSIILALLMNLFKEEETDK